MLFPEFTTSIG